MMRKLDPGRSVGLVLGRGGLIAVIVVAAVGIVGALVTLAVHFEYSINNFVSYEVPMVSPLDTRPDLVADADIQYATVHVEPLIADSSAILLESIGVSSRYAVAVLTCVVVIWLAVQLLRKRSFGVGTAISLGVLAAAMAAVAIAAPLLEAQATVMAVEALGLPTAPDPVGGSEEAATWLMPAVPHWQSSEWSLLALGLVTGLSALLLGRAARLQDDAEGLI
ncbi:hypothetical protein [Agrococcus citreus]|uniref:Uncharacterized protein n=1 Tax=Agrococcus citreus TaxID=84643 RepID=A0ABP4JPM1_9MICO